MRGQTKARQSALGIEIGTSAIKVVALRQAGRPELMRAVMAPTPIGSIQDGLITEPESVAATLRQLLAEGKINTRNAVTTVPNQASVIRSFQMAKLSPKEMPDAIRWESEKHLPYGPDEAIVDHDLLDDLASTPEGGEVEVMVAAATREAVGRQLQVMQLAGLDAQVLDLKPFALMRALHGSLQGGQERAIIEIGASSGMVMLCRGDRLLMSRAINVAADDFTTALQKEFQTDFNAAENAKLGYEISHIPTEDEEQLLDYGSTQFQHPQRVQEALRPVMNAMVNEVRRSLEYYRMQNGEVEVVELLLTGGGAKLRGVMPTLQEAMGITTKLADSWLGIDTTKAGADARMLERSGPEYAVPLGLALRGIGRHG